MIDSAYVAYNDRGGFVKRNGLESEESSELGRIICGQKMSGKKEM